MYRRGTENTQKEGIYMGYGIEFSEGYMGGGAWHGENSHKRFFGADLSKVIREELKANGIKGVSVSCKHLDHLYLKFKASDADFKPFDEYLADFGWNDLGSWCRFNGENKPRDIYWSLDEADRKKLLEENARQRYDYVKEWAEKFDYDVNGDFDGYKMFRAEFIEKMKKARMIVNSYNFDESNGMVDYFHRGFYDSYCVKYKPAA
jgi:hypothetical protein